MSHLLCRIGSRPSVARFYLGTQTLLLLYRYLSSLLVTTYSTNMATSSTEACENAVLTYLSTSEDACIEDTIPWAELHQLDPLVVVGAVHSLLTGGYVAATDLATSFYTLSPEAESILQHGSHEIVVLKAIVSGGKMSMEALQDAVGKDVAKIGMGNCLKNKWVKKEGADLVPIVTADAPPDDATQSSLQALADANYAKDAIDDKVRPE